jgi:hypothetical protein
MSKYEDCLMFTIDGPIEAFQTAPGVVNLIEDIQQGAEIFGVVGAVTDQPALATNAAAIRDYEGERVQHIALLINGRMAIGSFEHLRDLEFGDDITAVVSENDDGPLFLHAILRKKDQLLWTPVSVHHTCHGWMLHGIKLGVLIFSLTWLLLGSIFIFSSGTAPRGMDFLWFFLGSAAMIGFVVTMSVRGLMHLGAQAEEIFRVLQVPKYDRFRIKPYSLFMLNFKDDPHYAKKGNIFKFDDALAAHNQKFNLA